MTQSAAIFDKISELIAPLGYEVVHFEIQNHREKVLRIFIDRLESAPAEKPGIGPGIGIEDCANVSRALDEPLEGFAELDAVFHGASYELEVSSPGVDRPLRGEKDFRRYAGREVRVHTFRPLSPEEAGNPEYISKNPKQKNFVGTLLGPAGETSSARGAVGSEAIRLALRADADSPARKKGQKSASQIVVKEILIPFTLISKANLEPDFSVLERDQAESENEK